MIKQCFHGNCGGESYGVRLPRDDAITTLTLVLTRFGAVALSLKPPFDSPVPYHTAWNHLQFYYRDIYRVREGMPYTFCDSQEASGGPLIGPCTPRPNSLLREAFWL